MRTHGRIRLRLYDYIQGELPPDDHSEIERHLMVCSRCRSLHEQMAGTLREFDRPATLPSEERSEMFWSTFAGRVEQRVQAAEAPSRNADGTIGSALQWIMGMRWRTAFAIAGGFAVITVAFLLWQGRPEPPVSRQAEVLSPGPSTSTRVDMRMTEYLRKSQTLLVGLTNKKPLRGKPVDIDAEREASRSLVKEARFMKRRPLDPRSARLVGDLERIFIEVANSEPGARTGDLEVIRNGIRQENLLFKVRMAQARYEPAYGK